MSTTAERPTDPLQRMVWQAWLDLKEARANCDIDGMLRAERQLNAFLDQIAAKTLATAS